MPSTDEWRPIEEAPKDGTELLLYADGKIAIAYWNKYMGWMSPEDNLEAHIANDAPTHFRPLPAPPIS